MLTKRNFAGRCFSGSTLTEMLFSYRKGNDTTELFLLGCVIKTVTSKCSTVFNKPGHGVCIKDCMCAGTGFQNANMLIKKSKLPVFLTATTSNVVCNEENLTAEGVSTLRTACQNG
ncbi:hypothetical protein AVEN_224101-1 [Araneus ventricosus]|uniref:Uncharacterized protein n=1 Tax=Araneus ventricosus TaxID=182803 RepID=A0A4Y2DVG7_ARAVE|nr:hypothetical protein AVEN_224101-1 [Araneus ventricosus]